jgi:hypothetical protein
VERKGQQGRGGEARARGGGERDNKAPYVCGGRDCSGGAVKAKVKAKACNGKGEQGDGGGWRR